MLLNFCFVFVSLKLLNYWIIQSSPYLDIRYCTVHFCKYLQYCIGEVGVIKSYFCTIVLFFFSVFVEFKVEPRYSAPHHWPCQVWVPYGDWDVPGTEGQAGNSLSSAGQKPNCWTVFYTCHKKGAHAFSWSGGILEVIVEVFWSSSSTQDRDERSASR